MESVAFTPPFLGCPSCQPAPLFRVSVLPGSLFLFPPFGCAQLRRCRGRGPGYFLSPLPPPSFLVCPFCSAKKAPFCFKVTPRERVGRRDDREKPGEFLKVLSTQVRGKTGKKFLRCVLNCGGQTLSFKLPQAPPIPCSSLFFTGKTAPVVRPSLCSSVLTPRE